jgi:hypothetical protein
LDITADIVAGITPDIAADNSDNGALSKFMFSGDNIYTQVTIEATTTVARTSVGKALAYPVPSCSPLSFPSARKYPIYRSDVTEYPYLISLPTIGPYLR